MRLFEQEEEEGGEDGSNKNNDQENERIAQDYEFLRKYLHYAATEVKNRILTSEASSMLRT
ncbi:MAG: hypothetical protein M3270_05355 [Thermoproteota archaeon]|nr:hypothetical protein [Thermoproteota archaeon]